MSADSRRCRLADDLRQVATGHLRNSCRTQVLQEIKQLPEGPKILRVLVHQRSGPTPSPVESRRVGAVMPGQKMAQVSAKTAT